LGREGTTENTYCGEKRSQIETGFKVKLQMDEKKKHEKGTSYFGEKSRGQLKIGNRRTRGYQVLNAKQVSQHASTQKHRIGGGKKFLQAMKGEKDEGRKRKSVNQ
jgi:hypothetical protein